MFFLQYKIGTFFSDSNMLSLEKQKTEKIKDFRIHINT